MERQLFFSKRRLERVRNELRSKREKRCQKTSKMERTGPVKGGEAKGGFRTQ